jgi:putative FmdB family regulatory protein
MPTYDYRCEKCGNTFTVLQSMRAQEKKETRCPNCQSAEVSQMVSPFTAQTSRKS